MVMLMPLRVDESLRLQAAALREMFRSTW